MCKRDRLRLGVKCERRRGGEEKCGEESHGSRLAETMGREKKWRAPNLAPTLTRWVGLAPRSLQWEQFPISEHSGHDYGCDGKDSIAQFVGPAAGNSQRYGERGA